MRIQWVVLWFLALSLTAGAAELDWPPLQPDDLYLLDGPQQSSLSPDLKSMAFVRRWVDGATKEERYSLWLRITRFDRPRALETNEPDARAPVWSPDGQWIAIRSTRPRPEGWDAIPPAPPQSDPATDVWLVSADGRRVLPLAGPQKPYGRVFLDPFYARVSFSPDGRQLVFVADDGSDPRTDAEREAETYRVRVDQGEGYTGFGAAQIWVADLDLSESATQAAQAIRRLTSDDTWYGDPQWTPDGRFLICHVNKSDDLESVRFSINKNYDLWRIDAATGEQTQLTTNPGPDVSPRISADGRVIYLTVPRKGPHADVYNLALWPAPTSGAVLYDHHAAPDQPAPHPIPVFPLPDECWESPQSVLYTTASGLKSEAYRVNLDTKAGEPFVIHEGPAASTIDQRQLAALLLTPRGNAILKERLLGTDRVFHWKNENLSLEGALTVPPAEVAQPPYPLVVYPHGGPHSRSSLGFNFTAQVLAGQGYLVFQPNFRGSAGYGRQFLDADRNDMGGGDMRDLLTGIDALVKENLVDPQRQFVYGISYGGFMTSWLVGQTPQFRAAIAQNAVTDLNVMWGLSDLQSWTEWEYNGHPWEVPEAMRQHSPFTFIGKVQTPTLILHSRDDRRCPIAMGRMFYQGLQSRRVPSEMIVYPDEGHGIKQPKHQVDVLRRLTTWIKRYDPVHTIEIVTLGDSITAGARPGVTRSQTFAALLERQLFDQNLPVRVTNVGIGGERTDQALLRLDKDVISRKPLIVTIMYGTNDSYIDKGRSESRLPVDTYRQNLVTLVERLRAAGVKPVLMTEPRWGKSASPNGVGENPNIRLEPYVAACRDVARELLVPLVDHYAHWTTAETAGQVLGAWTTDQCHPNAAGHRVLTETILPVLEPQLAN